MLIPRHVLWLSLKSEQHEVMSTRWKIEVSFYKRQPWENVEFYKGKGQSYELQYCTKPPWGRGLGKTEFYTIYF